MSKVLVLDVWKEFGCYFLTELSVDLFVEVLNLLLDVLPKMQEWFVE